MAHRVTQHGRFELRGPYFDGTFAIVERRDGILLGRGLLKTRAAALARIKELSAEQVSA